MSKWRKRKKRVKTKDVLFGDEFVWAVEEALKYALRLDGISKLEWAVTDDAKVLFTNTESGESLAVSNLWGGYDETGEPPLLGFRVENLRREGDEWVLGSAADDENLDYSEDRLSRVVRSLISDWWYQTL